MDETKNNALNLSPLFWIALITSLATAVTLYGLVFDDLSEAQLVLYSPLWVTLGVFGATGLFATRAAALVNDGAAADMSEGMLLATRVSGLVRMILLRIPHLFFDVATIGKTPLKIATLTTVFWGTALVLFFQVAWARL